MKKYLNCKEMFIINLKRIVIEYLIVEKKQVNTY